MVQSKREMDISNIEYRKSHIKYLHYDNNKSKWVCPYCGAGYGHDYESKPQPTYCMKCKGEWL